MAKKRFGLLILCFCGLTPLSFVYASNTAAEDRIRFEITKRLQQGEVIELNANNKKFLAILKKSSQPATQGGVLILHGLNQNPDSPAVINPLRTNLTRSGWDTLSLQMPIPSMDGAGNIFPALDVVYPTLAEEAAVRINAAIDFFSNLNMTNLVIVGYGLGANLAVSYLSADAAKKIQSLAIISMDSSHPANFSENLSKLKLPILDVYASRDVRTIVSGADERKQAITVQGSNPDFRQRAIEGADHYYTGLESELFSNVRAWLGKTSPGLQLTGGR
jgi:dienelactone hydrolase